MVNMSIKKQVFFGLWFFVILPFLVAFVWWAFDHNLPVGNVRVLGSLSGIFLCVLLFAYLLDWLFNFD